MKGCVSNLSDSLMCETSLGATRGPMCWKQVEMTHMGDVLEPGQLGATPRQQCHKGV